MSDNPRSHTVLFTLIMTTFIFLISTIVTAGLSGLLMMLGDTPAGRVVGWVAMSSGALLAISLILLIFATAMIQYFEHVGRNGEDE